MATTSKNMNVFYRQKKTTTTTTSTAKRSTKNPFHKDVVVAITQPPTLVSHGGSLDLKGDFDEEEQVRRQLDMNMAHIRIVPRYMTAGSLGKSTENEAKSS